MNYRDCRGCKKSVGLFGRVFHALFGCTLTNFTCSTIDDRPMTPKEKAAFDKAFRAMGEFWSEIR